MFSWDIHNRPAIICDIPIDLVSRINKFIDISSGAEVMILSDMMSIV